MDQIEVDTNDLKVGLYVARLDRPWLETPFLFQGFRIRDEEELAELRKYCRSVIVDMSQSNVSLEDSQVLREAAARTGETSTSRIALPSRDKSHPADVPEPDPTRTGRYYVDTEKLAREMERAEVAQKDATAAVSHIMDRLRDGHSLDVPQLEEAVDPLVDSVLRNRDAMAWLTRIRATDEYVYQHSIGSSVWAVIFGRHLGFDKEALAAAGLGGMLLDIGKTKVPLEILRKPEPLTEKEAKLMRRHVEFGLDILKESGDVDPRVEIMVASHHERFDGSGYPNALGGTDIPVLGRIAGIVDTYDAMITRKPYRNAVSSFDAMRELQGLGRSRFQAEMIDQFVQAVGMFPTGSLVELNTGEVGIVVAQNDYQRLRPEVMIILDGDKQLCGDFRTIDLRLTNEDDINRRALWIDRGLETGAFGIDPSEYFL